MNPLQQLAASLITRSAVFEPKTSSFVAPSAELSDSLAELTLKSFDVATQPVLKKPTQVVQHQLKPITQATASTTRPVQYETSRPEYRAALQNTPQGQQVAQALAMLQSLRNKKKDQSPKIIGNGSPRPQFDLSAGAKIHPPKSNGKSNG